MFERNRQKKRWWTKWDILFYWEFFIQRVFKYVQVRVSKLMEWSYNNPRKIKEWTKSVSEREKVRYLVSTMRVSRERWDSRPPSYATWYKIYSALVIRMLWFCLHKPKSWKVAAVVRSFNARASGQTECSRCYNI